MIALLQRVLEASVAVNGEKIAEIGGGWLILLGVEKGDPEAAVPLLANKILNLRAFPDENGKMNASVIDIKGELLLVSQFTLSADCWRGNRPGFSASEEPRRAEQLYLQMSLVLKESSLKVERGRFGNDMKVSLINDGPVTFILDSADRAGPVK